MFDRRAIMISAWARYRSNQPRSFNRQCFGAALAWAWKGAKDRATNLAIRKAQDATTARVRAEVEAERAAGAVREMSTAEYRELAISVTPFRMSASHLRSELAIAA